METTAFGREGETLARAYLEKKGMRFIERNFRRTHGEIDLIANFLSSWKSRPGAACGGAFPSRR